MTKKIYNQPSAKVIELDSTDMIAASAPSEIKMTKEEAQNYDSENTPNVSSDIWGSQW